MKKENLPGKWVLDGLSRVCSKILNFYNKKDKAFNEKYSDGTSKSLYKHLFRGSLSHYLAGAVVRTEDQIIKAFCESNFSGDKESVLESLVSLNDNGIILKSDKNLYFDKLDNGSYLVYTSTF